MAAALAGVAIWGSNIWGAYHGCGTQIPFFDRCVRVVLEEHNGKKKIYTTIEPVVEVGRVGGLTHLIYAKGDPRLPLGDAFIHKAGYETLSVKTASIVILEDYEAPPDKTTNAKISVAFNVAAYWSARSRISSQLTQVNTFQSDTNISHVEESDRISVTPLIRFEPSIQIPPIVSFPVGCGITQSGCEKSVTVNNDISTENYDQRRWVDNSTQLTDRSVHHHEGARIVSNTTIEKQATPDLKLVLNSNFMIDGQPVLLKRENERHLLVPYFIEPVEVKNYGEIPWFFGNDETINSMVEAFVAGYNSYQPNTWSDRSGERTEGSYLGLVRDILRACSGLDELPIDVVGYASIKKFKNFSSDSNMHDRLNWALAEGRRARVIEALLGQGKDEKSDTTKANFVTRKGEKPRFAIYSGPVVSGGDVKSATKFDPTYRELITLAKMVQNSNTPPSKEFSVRNAGLESWLERQFGVPQRSPMEPKIGPKFTASAVGGNNLVNAASSLRQHLGELTNKHAEGNDPLREAFQRGAVISIQTKVLQKCTSP